MDASQLQYPETVHSVPKHKFFTFYLLKVSEMIRTLRNINCVQWSRMDALELQYPETVHSVPKHKFCIFYLLKASEMIQHTHKHQLCPME
jgi:hypothetical protein